MFHMEKSSRNTLIIIIIIIMILIKTGVENFCVLHFSWHTVWKFTQEWILHVKFILNSLFLWVRLKTEQWSYYGLSISWYIKIEQQGCCCLRQNNNFVLVLASDATLRLKKVVIV